MHIDFPIDSQNLHIVKLQHNPGIPGCWKATQNDSEKCESHYVLQTQVSSHIFQLLLLCFSAHIRQPRGSLPSTEVSLENRTYLPSFFLRTERKRSPFLSGSAHSQCRIVPAIISLSSQDNSWHTTLPSSTISKATVCSS